MYLVFSWNTELEVMRTISMEHWIGSNVESILDLIIYLHLLNYKNTVVGGIVLLI